MPYARPSLTALRTQAMQDIAASGLTGANGFLRNSVLRVLAWVQAGMAHLHYGFLDWIAKESIPFTCDAEFLDGWAALKGVTRKAATAATGTWTGTGVNGSVLSAGIALIRADQVQYVTTASATVLSGTVTVAIAAVVAGANGNADIATPLSLANTVTGINATGAAGTALTGGADIETDAALRTRMLQAYAAPSQGGAKADYVTWALQVAGVTRAWCNPNGLGVGTAVVYTMFDVTEAAYNGFPQGTNGVATAETRGTVATGDQLAVANHIYPLRPVTALVYSYAPAPQALAFTVAGLNPNTAAMQTAVTAALTALLMEKASPLADTAIDQSDADAAILAVPGVVSFRVTAPSFPQTPTLGNIFTLGTVTFA